MGQDRLGMYIQPSSVGTVPSEGLHEGAERVGAARGWRLAGASVLLTHRVVL